MKNILKELLNIECPIIQGGMVWCSGWRLASAVSNCGGLGLLGAGSMRPDLLKEHIQKTKDATNRPFGVNVPLMYPDIEELMEIIVKENVPIVFTSAGSPKKWTPYLQSKGIKVVHVVSSTLFAKKCEDAGVNAIVAEGFEAGGHNGREETASFPLLQEVCKSVSIPVIAAGGMYGGESLLAAQILGASGVQIGSRFAVCKESSAHELFKQEVLNTGEGDTLLSLKKLAPTRLMKNDFFNKIHQMEASGASAEELREVLGKGRAKKGIFEGNLQEGELEIGQIASKITQIETVNEIMKDIIDTYNERLDAIKKFNYYL